MDEARAAGAGGQGVGGAEKRRRENVGDARLRRTADLGHVHAPQLLAHCEQHAQRTKAAARRMSARDDAV